MPVIFTRFLQPQLVPLTEVIKELFPAHANIIILCGVSVSLSTIVLLLLKRKRQHEQRLRRLAITDVTDDHENHAQPKKSLLPWTPDLTITSKVNFKLDTADRQLQDERTITTMSEGPQTDNLDLQRRKSYASKVDSLDVDERNGEIIVAEGWTKHIRVYGSSGPCPACVESEERMRAMNLALSDRQAQEARPSEGKPPAENSTQEPSQ